MKTALRGPDHQKTQALYLLGVARAGRPNVRYAVADDYSAIGAWVDSVARFVMVASLGIDGNWYSVPVEILVNGNPPYAAERWSEGGAA